MNKETEMFFESYGKAVKAAYDTYLAAAGRGRPEENGDSEDKLHMCLQAEYEKWLRTPLAVLGERTPAEYMEAIDSLDTLAGMFAYGAVACDDGLPEIYVDKLKGFGEGGIDALLDIAVQNGAGDSEEEYLASLVAVKVLGGWKAEKAVEPIIKLLDTEGEYSELMHETVRDALIGIGVPALDGILKALDSGSNSQTAAEYLLMALSDIGKTNRSDRIYLQLKKAFIETEQKLVIASCLANYGDGRAVPALRGCLEKNKQRLNKETFYEIVSAIRRLGGRIDDLKL